jgi:hypothetical protein
MSSPVTRLLLSPFAVPACRRVARIERSEVGAICSSLCEIETHVKYLFHFYYTSPEPAPGAAMKIA